MINLVIQIVLAALAAVFASLWLKEKSILRVAIQDVSTATVAIKMIERGVPISIIMSFMSENGSVALQEVMEWEPTEL